MNNQRVVQTDALPPNVVNPLPAGATNIFDAGIIAQHNNNQLQNSLINGSKQNGGIRRRKRIRGGKRIQGGGTNPVVVVPSAPSYSPASGGNYKGIAELANKTAGQAVFDNTVTGNQSQVGAIAAKQDITYYGVKGGSKRTRRKSRRSKRRKSKRRKYSR